MSEKPVERKEKKSQLITNRVLLVNRRTGQVRCPVYIGGVGLRYEDTGRQIDPETSNLLDLLSDPETCAEGSTDEGSTSGSPERR